MPSVPSRGVSSGECLPALHVEDNHLARSNRAVACARRACVERTAGMLCKIGSFKKRCIVRLPL